MFSPFVQSLLIAISVGAAAAYLGSLMITKKMALVGDALGHVALPGMGLALLLNIDVSLGAFASLLAGILIVWRLGETTLLSPETLVGIIFVASLALGFLIVPQPELLESLIGDISRTSMSATLISIVISAAVIILVRRIYKGMILLNISQDLAAIEGISARLYNLAFLFAIALIVALGVKITGSLLVGALLIIPSATARIVTTNLGSYARISVVLGVLSSTLGVVTSEYTNFPAGPSIILVGFGLFVIAALVRRYYRLSRR